MSSIYLIDYENVHESGLSGVKDLKEGDRVIVFYGDKIKSISFDVHIQMMHSKAVVEYIETHKTAKNYLDFQLGTYLGFLIGAGSHDDVVIVSHDTGFDSVVDFWQDRGHVICRRENISEKLPQTAAAKEKETEKKTGSEGRKKSAQKVKPDVDKNREKAANPNEPANAARVQQRNAEKQNPKNVEKPAGNADSEQKDADSQQKNTDRQEKRGKKQDRRPREEKPAEGKAEEKKAPAEPIQIPEKAEVKEADIPAPEKTEEPETAVLQEDLKDAAEAASEKKGTEAAAPKKSESQKKPDLPEIFRKKVRAALRSDKLSSGNYTTIYRALSGSRDKLSLNNTLVKAYGSEKGGEVYNRIREIFAEFQASRNGQH